MQPTLATLCSHIIRLPPTVAAASNRFRNRHRQEVRHDHYAVHRLQHVNDDHGPLPTIRSVRQRARLSEHDIHLYLQLRVSDEDFRTALPLLCGAMELLRSGGRDSFDFG